MRFSLLIFFQFMLPLLWHMRYCLDLNQEFFSGQFSYLHKGACRWVECIHIAVADLAEGWELGDINHVDIQLDHVGEISSHRRKCCLEIFKDLLGLSTEIMR